MRDFNEVSGGTIPAANWNHLPLGEIGEALQLDAKSFELIYEIKKPSKDQKVIFYCMKGRRSDMAGRLWEQSTGSENIYHYPGGWKEWNDKWTKGKLINCFYDEF